MAPIQVNKDCSAGAYGKKKVSSFQVCCRATHLIFTVVFPSLAPPTTSSRSAFTLWYLNRFSWLKESFTNIKPPLDQNNIIERVIIDVVCSWRRPVNSFTDVSFITVVYGPQGDFFAAIPRVATGGKTGCKAEQRRRIQLLLYIRDFYRCV